MLDGDGYERDMMHSLGNIKKKSTILKEQALKSHMYQTNEYSRQTLQSQNYMQEGIEAMRELLEAQLSQYQRDRDALIAQVKAATQEIVHLRVENGVLRATTPPAQAQPLALLLASTQPLLPQAAFTNTISSAALLAALDVPPFDLTDTQTVLDADAQIPRKERARAQQIVGTTHFRTWIMSPRSAKLLVHRGSRGGGLLPTTGLSLVCAGLARAFRARQRFLSLVWFCGRHTGDSAGDGDGEDSDGSRLCGGKGMLISLIGQLLRQLPPSSIVRLGDTLDIPRIREGMAPLADLCRLFTVLVQQLPDEVTLTCLIDGIAFYEREEFEDEALEALACILSLVVDGSVRAAVKVLLLSPCCTDTVREAFEEEDLILSMEAMAQAGSEPSEARMGRDLWGDEDSTDDSQ